jgi:hypothetical protein
MVIGRSTGLPFPSATHIITGITIGFRLVHAKRENMEKDKVLLKVLDPRGQPSGIFGHGLGANLRPGASMDPFTQPGSEVQRSRMGQRLASLENKTIYLVNGGFAGSQEFLEDTQSWFNRHFPSTKTVLIRKPGSMFNDAPELWAEIKKKGDAVIFGVGG